MNNDQILRRIEELERENQRLKQIVEESGQTPKKMTAHEARTVTAAMKILRARVNPANCARTSEQMRAAVNVRWAKARQKQAENRA